MSFVIFLIIFTLALGILAILLALGAGRSFDKEVERKHIADPDEWERKLKEKGLVDCLHNRVRLSSAKEAECLDCGFIGDKMP